MMLAAAGFLFLPDAPAAAQPGRSAMAQHATPFHHAAPAFRPPPAFRTAPIQYAPPRGAGRPGQVVPPFVAAPHGNFHAVNPNPFVFNPGRPFTNSGALRPSLPLNSPSALRPNLPLNPGAHEPDLRANNPGAFTPAPLLNNPNPVQQGSAVPFQGAASQTPTNHGPLSQPPAAQAPVSRPLLKAPPGGFPQTRPAFPVVQRNDRFWPLHKDRKFMWLRGQRHFFVPVALLGVVLIGDSYWYPDGYVSMEGPACTGYTANGCQLQWRMVDFDDGDGGGEPQCVQYCPQVGTPPEQVATLPPPPPLAQGGACLTTIYSAPNFDGNSAPTGDSQPILSQTGWRNEIASIVVRAGTWDFFADENFGGESLRLTPGTYPTLPPEWTRHIGSFICAEPGPPPA
jgi:hypothetical protein